MGAQMHADEVPVSERLVRSLLQEQMPDYANEPIAIVEPWGTDNAIFRVGQDFVVRLPRIEWAVNQVAFEHQWLPKLDTYMSVTLPEPIAIGQPGCGYPFVWALHRWVPGVGASPQAMADPLQFAVDLAHAISELQRVPTTGAPPAKNRARDIRDYDDATRKAIEAAGHLIDADAALEIWQQAVDAPPCSPQDRRWVHGDLEGNCVLLDGQLHGLIDWGLACVGDPAVEVQTIWSPLFTEDSRAAFLSALNVDDATIARARGAAINQACGALPYYLDTYPLIVERSWHKLAALGVQPITST